MRWNGMDGGVRGARLASRRRPLGRRHARCVLGGGLLTLAIVCAGCPAATEIDTTPRGQGEGASSNASQPAPASEPKDAATPPATVPQAGKKAGSSTSGSASEVAAQGKPQVAPWPAPDLLLAFSGRQRGYIEPCGCTGLANQKGGLARRFTLLSQLRKRGWNVAPIDVGNQIRRYGTQAEIKFQFTMQGLQEMGYEAISLGPNDLRLPATMLAGVTLPADASQKSRFFCGDASLFGDRSFLPPVRIVASGEHKIGVTSVMDEVRRGQITSSDVAVREAQQAVAAARAELNKAKTDFDVLIVHGSSDFAKKLAAPWKELDLIVCTGEPGEPEPELRSIEGSGAKLLLIGDKGMFICLVGITWDDEPVLRYQSVPLDARFDDAPEMLKLLASYQQALKQKGLEGLGVEPQPHPSGHQFVGSAACAECHEEAYAVWKDGIDGEGGPHAHATESLVRPGERSEIPRHHDPECLSCHVTGWNPPKYYPYESGYLSLEGSKHLHGNGCENCHGPGSAHVAAENGDVEADEAKLESLRQALHLELDQAEDRCMECHDLDNSPDFHVRGAFEKYWEKIEH